MSFSPFGEWPTMSGQIDSSDFQNKTLVDYVLSLLTKISWNVSYNVFSLVTESLICMYQYHVSHNLANRTIRRAYLESNPPPQCLLELFNLNSNPLGIQFRWNSESVSSWVRKSVSPWVRESVSPWVRESVSPWVRESVSPWVRESVSPWVRESVSVWT